MPSMRRHWERIRMICFGGSLILFLLEISNSFFFTPSFVLKSFNIPALGKSLNSSSSASITFDVYLGNLEPESKVYFDPINLIFYDGPGENHSIANFIVPKFYVEGGKGAHYSGVANATGFDLDAANREILVNGFKVFRLGLETYVRYEYYWFWKTRMYGYRKGVNVKAIATFGNNLVGIKEY